MKIDELATQAEKLKLGQRDLDDIRASDVFVQFNYDEHYIGDRTCGRHVELGIAIAMNKPIIVVGQSRTVFHGFAKLVIPISLMTEHGLLYGVYILSESIRVCHQER